MEKDSKLIATLLFVEHTPGLVKLVQTTPLKNQPIFQTLTLYRHTFLTMEVYFLLDKEYFLVNLKSCHARVLNWAIRENIRPVELAQYSIFPYWASFTGRILSRIAQLRTLLWQL